MFDLFLKGHHKICQDYVRIEDNFAILADGCSSAKHTDIGARILAHARTYYDSFIGFTIGKANFIRSELSLPSECLFSTLGEIRKENNTLLVNLWGDGVCVIKSRLNFNVWKISYDKAPYYPVYDYLTNGRESYIKEFGLPIVKYDISYDQYSKTHEIKEPFEKSFSASINIDELEYILLFSDGVCAFQKDYKEIIKELCEFKSFQGEFLQRRLSALFKRQWKDYHCMDDFSCVAYYNDTLERKE